VYSRLYIKTLHYYFLQFDLDFFQFGFNPFPISSKWAHSSHFIHSPCALLFSNIASAFFRPTCRSPMSFLSRSEICIDLFSPSLSLRKNCYRKEILLVWRYCFLDRIYRHEICVKVEKILFDSRLSYSLQVKRCYLFLFLCARVFVSLSH